MTYQHNPVGCSRFCLYRLQRRLRRMASRQSRQTAHHRNYLADRHQNRCGWHTSNRNSRPQRRLDNHKHSLLADCVADKRKSRRESDGKHQCGVKHKKRVGKRRATLCVNEIQHSIYRCDTIRRAGVWHPLRQFLCDGRPADVQAVPPLRLGNNKHPDMAPLLGNKRLCRAGIHHHCDCRRKQLDKFTHNDMPTLPRQFKPVRDSFGKTGCALSENQR